MQVSFYVPQTASFLRKCIVITFHHRKMHVLDVRHFFQVDKYAWTERRVFTEVGRQAEKRPPTPSSRALSKEPAQVLPDAAVAEDSEGAAPFRAQ